MKSPVLFLIFNRLEPAVQVFHEIRLAKPSRLYIASDGPRPDKIGEASCVERVRQIVLDGVDWPCQVKTLFRDINLGCREAVSGAISWFFTHEESGVILEDDCLPDPSFFVFCDELLEKYRYDERIMHISGNNFQHGMVRGDGSYYFSRLPHSWGWATWRRAWSKYSVFFNQLEQQGEKGLAGIFKNKAEEKVWRRRIWQAFTGKTNSWATLWCYANLASGSLSILPNKNLIQNIGFGRDATHTKGGLGAYLRRQSIGAPLIHPKALAVDVEADDYTYRTVYGLGARIYSAWGHLMARLDFRGGSGHES